MEDLQDLLGGVNQPQMPGGNEYTIKGIQQALDDARFANHGLAQNELSEWKRTVTAGTAEQTGNDMEEIKGLFDELAAAASQAQGDRALTNQYIAEIARLNAKLKECLDLLLRIITHLMQKDSDASETVERLRATIQNAPDLNLIKTELQALITYISTQQVDRTRFQRELQRLADEIKRMCQKGEELEERLRRDNSGGNSGSDGSSGGKVSDSEEIGGDMSKHEESVSTSAPIDLMGWAPHTDPNSGQTFYSCTGQESRWLPPAKMCDPQSTTTSAFSGSGGTDTPESVGRTDRGESLTQQRQSSEDFGTIFNCASHGHARLGIDLRKDIIEKMISWARASGREAAAKKLARYADQHLYTSPRCAHVLKSLGYSRGDVLAARLKSEMDRNVDRVNLLEARNRAWTSAASHEGGRRRRTRKKRAGWRTPEKGSPMRTLYTKENKKKKKKHTKKKKNKRKKRKKKGTRRRRNRKR